MNPQYLITDDNVYMKDVVSTTDPAENYPEYPNRNNFFEHDLLINYSPVLRLADITKEVAVLEANLPEYKVTYDGAKNRSYKVVIHGVVDTTLKFPHHTVKNGVSVKNIFLPKGQFLVLNFTVTYNKYRMVVLEADLNIENNWPQLGEVATVLKTIQEQTAELEAFTKKAEEDLNSLQNGALQSQATQSGFQLSLDAANKKIEGLADSDASLKKDYTLKYDDVKAYVQMVDNEAKVLYAEVQKSVAKVEQLAQGTYDEQITSHNEFNVMIAGIQTDLNNKVAAAKLIAEQAKEKITTALSNINTKLTDLDSAIAQAKIDIGSDVSALKIEVANQKSNFDGFVSQDKADKESIKTAFGIADSNLDTKINDINNALNNTTNKLDKLATIHTDLTIPGLANINADLNGTKKKDGRDGYGVYRRIEKLEAWVPAISEVVTKVPEVEVLVNAQAQRLDGEILVLKDHDLAHESAITTMNEQIALNKADVAKKFDDHNRVHTQFITSALNSFNEVLMGFTPDNNVKAEFDKVNATIDAMNKVIEAQEERDDMLENEHVNREALITNLNTMRNKVAAIKISADGKDLKPGTEYVVNQLAITISNGILDSVDNLLKKKYLTIAEETQVNDYFAKFTSGWNPKIAPKYDLEYQSFINEANGLLDTVTGSRTRPGGLDIFTDEEWAPTNFRNALSTKIGIVSGMNINEESYNDIEQKVSDLKTAIADLNANKAFGTKDHLDLARISYLELAINTLNKWLNKVKTSVDGKDISHTETWVLQSAYNSFVAKRDNANVILIQAKDSNNTYLLTKVGLETEINTVEEAFTLAASTEKAGLIYIANKVKYHTPEGWDYSEMDGADPNTEVDATVNWTQYQAAKFATYSNVNTDGTYKTVEEMVPGTIGFMARYDEIDGVMGTDFNEIGIVATINGVDKEGARMTEKDVIAPYEEGKDTGRWGYVTPEGTTRFKYGMPFVKNNNGVWEQYLSEIAIYYNLYKNGTLIGIAQTARMPKVTIIPNIEITAPTIAEAKAWDTDYIFIGSDDQLLTEDKSFTTTELETWSVATGGDIAVPVEIKGKIGVDFATAHMLFNDEELEPNNYLSVADIGTLSKNCYVEGDNTRVRFAFKYTLLVTQEYVTSGFPAELLNTWYINPAYKGKMFSLILKDSNGIVLNKVDVKTLPNMISN